MSMWPGKWQKLQDNYEQVVWEEAMLPVNYELVVWEETHVIGQL